MASAQLGSFCELRPDPPGEVTAPAKLFCALVVIKPTRQWTYHEFSRGTPIGKLPKGWQTLRIALKTVSTIRSARIAIAQLRSTRQAAPRTSESGAACFARPGLGLGQGPAGQAVYPLSAETDDNSKGAPKVLFRLPQFCSLLNRTGARLQFCRTWLRRLSATRCNAGLPFTIRFAPSTAAMAPAAKRPRKLSGMKLSNIGS